MQTHHTFPLPKKTELKKQVNDEWAYWRLVLSGKFDYNTVFNQMLPEEVLKANIALDKDIQMQNEAMKKKR